MLNVPHSKPQAADLSAVPPGRRRRPPLPPGGPSPVGSAEVFLTLLAPVRPLLPMAWAKSVDAGCSRWA